MLYIDVAVRRDGKGWIVRDLVVSSDPATVIFPSCVGVREREFTPPVSGDDDACRQAREGRPCKVRRTCARDSTDTGLPLTESNIE